MEYFISWIRHSNGNKSANERDDERFGNADGVVAIATMDMCRLN